MHYIVMSGLQEFFSCYVFLWFGVVMLAVFYAMLESVCYAIAYYGMQIVRVCEHGKLLGKKCII